MAGVSTSVTTGARSSFSIVSVTAAGSAAPRPPAVVPETRTLLSAATASLSAAVTVTRPALVVAPAAMVSVVPDCAKSLAVAGDTAAADTVTVTASPEGCESAAVTVAAPPFSEIASGDDESGSESSSVTVGRASSSAMAPVPVAAVAESVAFAGLLSATFTVSSASSAASPTTVTSTVATVSPAAMVSVPAASAV